MNISKLILEAFIETGQDLFTQHLITSHGGNLSLLAGDKIIITRRGARLHRLVEDDLIIADLKQEGGDSGLASRELPVHRAIYNYAAASAVVHAHPQTAISLSLTRESIVPRDKEGAFLLKEVPVVDENPKEIAKALKKCPVVLAKGHGSFARGKDLEEALHWTTTLEASARIVNR